MTNPVRAQGAQAKELGLTAFDCPYGPGENRDDWFAGAGFKDGDAKQVDPPRASVSTDDGRTTKKGKKGADAAPVVRPTGTGETSVTTVNETADPQQGDGGGATVTLGDPSASTTAAENGGDGLTLDED